MSISNWHEIVHRKRVFYWRLYGLPPLPTASLPPPPRISASWLKAWT